MYKNKAMQQHQKQYTYMRYIHNSKLPRHQIENYIYTSPRMTKIITHIQSNKVKTLGGIGELFVIDVLGAMISIYYKTEINLIILFGLACIMTTGGWFEGVPF